MGTKVLSNLIGSRNEFVLQICHIITMPFLKRKQESWIEICIKFPTLISLSSLACMEPTNELVF